MSENTTAVTMFKSNAPAYLQRGLDDTTSMLAGGGGYSKQISIKGGRFRLRADGEEVSVHKGLDINVVIIAAAPSVGRSYYEGAFVEGENKSPVCWSADGVTPDARAEAPQAKSCEKCPMNIAGSGQGNSKACRYSRKIAVLLESDLEGPVYSMTLPSTSIFGKAEKGKMPLQAYATFLKTHNCPVTGIVTNMEFDDSVSTPKLFFSNVRYLTQDEFELCQSRAIEPDTLQAVEFAFQPNKKAGEVVEDKAPARRAAVEEVEEPEVVSKGKKGKPADIKETIAKWDEED